MSDYLVIKCTKCETCGGTGFILHTKWEEFHHWQQVCKEANGAYPTPAQEDAWWQSEGYAAHAGQYPPEEIPCNACHGSGEIRTEVDLVDALHAVQGG